MKINKMLNSQFEKIEEKKYQQIDLRLVNGSNVTKWSKTNWIWIKLDFWRKQFFCCWKKNLTHLDRLRLRVRLRFGGIVGGVRGLLCICRSEWLISQ